MKDNYSSNYYFKNRESINKKKREIYAKEKETRKIYITLDGEYIEGVFHDDITGYKHCTTSSRDKAFKYNFYSIRRIRKYYESIGVEVGFEFIKETKHGKR